jgi:hypothetical protein
VVVERGKLYLAIVFDSFSRFVVRWAVNDWHLAFKKPLSVTAL